jgi:hypothetical protein
MKSRPENNENDVFGSIMGSTTGWLKRNIFLTPFSSADVTERMYDSRTTQNSRPRLQRQ